MRCLRPTARRQGPNEPAVGAEWGPLEHKNGGLRWGPNRGSEGAVVGAPMGLGRGAPCWVAVVLADCIASPVSIGVVSISRF